MGLSFAVAVYFIGALILEDTLWWGETDADLFFVCNSILVFTTVLYGTYSPDPRERAQVLRYIIFTTLGVYALAAGLSFFMTFDWSYIALALVAILVVVLIILAIREYLFRYALMAVFALSSLGFFYSVSYVFNDILQPHQQVRIKVALGIESDLRGKGYNVDQSKIAIGSGGLTGKGFLKGTQTKLNYVPEQETDFIFCTVGEESGFVGSAALVVFYGIFILRIVATSRATSISLRAGLWVLCGLDSALPPLHQCRYGAGACPGDRDPAPLLQLWGLVALGLHLPALYLDRDGRTTRATYRQALAPSEAPSPP